MTANGLARARSTSACHTLMAANMTREVSGYRVSGNLQSAAGVYVLFANVRFRACKKSTRAVACQGWLSEFWITAPLALPRGTSLQPDS